MILRRRNQAFIALNDDFGLSFLINMTIFIKKGTILNRIVWFWGKVTFLSWINGFGSKSTFLGPKMTFLGFRGSNWFRGSKIIDFGSKKGVQIDWGFQIDPGGLKSVPGGSKLVPGGVQSTIRGQNDGFGGLWIAKSLPFRNKPCKCPV